MKPPRCHYAVMIVGYVILHALFFSPVIFADRLLAPGDAAVYYLPTFLSPRTLWEPNIWGGFPVAADQQTTTWYPLALLFSFLPHAWNLYVLSAYVLASCFTYAYVYQLARSALAGFVSGTIYGLSGFMIAHLGHTTMIHNAAWLPLIIWSFENLRQRLGARWILTGAAAIALSALAGHPQIFAYTLCLGGAYVAFAGWRAPAGRWRFYATSLAITILGIGLAGVQLVPAIELGGASWRAQSSFAEFVTYRFPLKQIPTLIFPFLYGGAPSAVYGVRYFGEWPSSQNGWGITEVAGYVGILPLLLAMCGLFARPLKWYVRFWAAVALAALLLTLGNATPVAFLLFQIPVIKLFRAPARHFFEMSFAVSILAGFGVTAIRRSISSRCVLLILLACVLVALAGLMGLVYFRDDLTAFAASRGVANFTVSPARNNAIAIPLILVLVASATVLFLNRRKDGLVAAFLLLGVLIIDMGSFGWFCEWNYGSPRADFLERPPFVTRYQESLVAADQRMLPVRGGLGTLAEIPPNISRFWEVPSVSGYGPLIFARLRELLDMPAHGSVDGAWRDSQNQGLNILAVRYLFMPPAHELRSDTFSQQGLAWSVEDLGASLGTGCQTKSPDHLRFDLDEPVKADVVGVVSTLACSTELPNGAEAAQLRLIDEEGATHVRVLRAGKDASEWAYDCADVKPLVRHERAPIFRSYQAARESGPCEGHQYISLVNFPGLRKAVKSVEIAWTGRRGSMVVQKLTLLDQTQGRSTPLRMSPASLAGNSAWRQVEDLTDGVKVYENQRALPRAWLVGEVVQALPEQVLAAIRTSQLPDKRTFDARTMALVERPPPFASTERDPAASISITRLWKTGVELRANSAAAAFLVLGDVNYPGWEAFVDERPTLVYQTNYVLRGIAVPPGEHFVRFQFRPKSLIYGAALSGVCLPLALALGLFSKKFNRAFV